MNNWKKIITEKDFPPIYHFVLVSTTEETPQRIGIARINTENKWEFLGESLGSNNGWAVYSDIELCLHCQSITHWMPLPDMPHDQK